LTEYHALFYNKKKIYNKMLKRVNGFTGKLGNVGFIPTKSFPITNPTEPIQNEIKTQIQKPYTEKERKSKFQKK
jgi:hypothetical protein